MAEQCTSVGCMAAVTHMEALASGVPRPWCCQHYEGTIRLKQQIKEAAMERQYKAAIELLELQIKFLRSVAPDGA